MELPRPGSASSPLTKSSQGCPSTALHVADDVTAGREFLEQWVEDHGLDGVELLVETRDVEAAIGAAATDKSLVLVGATETGLLSRLIGGSLTLSVLGDLDPAVLLAERPRERSIRERLFGN